MITVLATFSNTFIADELVAGFTVEFKFSVSMLRAVMGGIFSKEFVMSHHPPLQVPFWG